MSNTNTEVLTTAYEKLQGAITQSNTVLPKLQEAIEKGNLDNYATTSSLEENANNLNQLIENSFNYNKVIGNNVILEKTLDYGVDINILYKNFIDDIQLSDSNANRWFNANISNQKIENDIVTFDFNGTWARNIIKIILPEDIVGETITFSFKSDYNVSSGEPEYVILGTTDFENVANDFENCKTNEYSFATYFKSKSGYGTFKCKTKELLISIMPTATKEGSGDVKLYDLLINKGTSPETYVPYYGYSIYSVNPLLTIDDCIYNSENNHRKIFKQIRFESNVDYFLYMPQNISNIRIALNTMETENTIQIIQDWGASFDKRKIFKFNVETSGEYYLDIWSSNDTDEVLTFNKMFLTNKYDNFYVDCNDSFIHLTTYLDNTAVFNLFNANMECRYLQRNSYGTVSKGTTYGIVTPEMFGAVGDGITDDTDAIQRCINSGYNIIMNNKYLVSKTQDVYIDLKKHTIPISIIIPSNRNIIIKGEIICNDKCNVLYSSGSNINIEGGEFKHASISTAGNYQMGSIALNHSTNVNIKNVTTNNAIVTTFFCKFINVHDCISRRTGDNRMNCAIGYHCTSHSTMRDNTVVGTHNDGDLICFGNCFNVTIDNNKLFSKCDFWADTGSQGICVDTACFKCKVINNYAEGYYNPIDVKTWANGNIISGNTLFANKQGITIRKGESNNFNNVDIISNNIIDMANGNGSASPIVGSESLGDYTTCGIYLEGVSNVLVSNNVIYSSIDMNKSIYIMLYRIIGNNTIKIENNTFNDSYIEYQISDYPTKYVKNSIFIAIGETDIKNAKIIINSNDFKINDVENNNIQIINIRYVKDIIFSNNTLCGTQSISNISNCSNVYITNNNGEINDYLANISDSNVLLVTGNTLQNKNATIQHLLNLTNVTTSISNNNTIFSVNNTLTDTGCTTKNDLIISS